MSSNIEERSWLATSAANILMTSIDHLIDRSYSKAQKFRSGLRMAMIKSNRRSGNYNRAFGLLCDEFARYDVRPDHQDNIEELVNVCKKLTPEKTEHKLGRLHLQCESAKLLHATDNVSKSVVLLADSLSTYLESNAGKSTSEICSRG